MKKNREKCGNKVQPERESAKRTQADPFMFEFPNAMIHGTFLGMILSGRKVKDEQLPYCGSYQELPLLAAPPTAVLEASVTLTPP